MSPGLSADLQYVNDARKTAIINDELLRLQLDIVALQETRLAGSGTLKEKDYTFFWQGKSAEECREQRASFAVMNSSLKMVETGNKGCERQLTLRLHTSNEAKDEFYTKRNDVIENVHNEHFCLGHFGVDKINENGQGLLELCSYHGLCVTNSYFHTKPQHKVSWRHPRSKHWHQLDMVIVKRMNLKFMLCTRTYHSAEYDTDHSLVCSKIRLLPKKIHHNKQVGKPRINTTKMQYPEKVEEFAKYLDYALSANHPHSSATEKWEHLWETIQKTAFATYGRKTSKNHDWFKARSSEMTPVIEAKRAVLAEYMGI
ncbi:hypothetical protein ACOMHN_036946 [Nucella lapillus]